MNENREGGNKEIPFLTSEEFQRIQTGDPKDPSVLDLLKDRGIELSDKPGTVMTVVVDGLPRQMSIYKEDLGTIHQEIEI